MNFRACLVIAIAVWLSVQYCAAQNYVVSYSYAVPNCSGDEVGVTVVETGHCTRTQIVTCDSKTGKITVQDCAGANCAQPCHVNQTFNIGDCERGAKIVCSDDFPDIPEGDVMAYGYSTSANCNGDHDFVTTLSAGVCIETESGYLTAECSVDKQTVTLSSCQDSNCQTCASNTLPLGCFQLGGAGSINFQCSEGSSQDSESGLSSGAKAGIAILVLLLLLLTLTAILYFAFRNHPKVKPLLPGFLRPQGSSDIGTTTWGFEKGSTALDEGLLEDINETDVRS